MSRIKNRHGYLNRAAPKHSENRTKSPIFSRLKPAANALAKAIPCSFCSMARRASRALKSRCLNMKKQGNYWSRGKKKARTNKIKTGIAQRDNFG